MLRNPFLELKVHMKYFKIANPYQKLIGNTAAEYKLKW